MALLTSMDRQHGREWELRASVDEDEWEELQPGRAQRAHNYMDGMRVRGQGEVGGGGKTTHMREESGAER